MGLGLLVFTFVFLVGTLLKLTDKLLESGVPAHLALELILLILPSVMAITVPMAVLVGILLGIGRLAADREILAIRASGISLFQIAKPIAALAILLSAFMIWANMQLIPYLNLKFADLQTQVLFKALSSIPAGEAFPIPTEGQGNDSSILIDYKDPDTGTMHGITMLAKWKADSSETANRTQLAELATSTTKARAELEAKLKDDDKKKDKKKSKESALEERKLKEQQDWNELLNERMHEVLIVAETGVFEPQIENRVVYVRLTTGSIHLTDPDNKGAYDVIRFDSFTRGIVPSFDKIEKGYFEKDPREMTNRELKAQIAYRDKGRKYSVELYRRYSVPLACLAFALIALPLAVYVRPTGKAVAFGLSFLLILFYYGMLEYGVALTHNNSSIGPFAMFLPNLIVAGIGIFMLYRMVTK